MLPPRHEHEYHQRTEDSDRPLKLIDVLVLLGKLFLSVSPAVLPGRAELSLSGR